MKLTSNFWLKNVCFCFVFFSFRYSLFKLDNMLLLYKTEQREQQRSSNILFFSLTEESPSHRFGASWRWGVNYTFKKFLRWMCPLESSLNFRVLTVFLIWDHRRIVPSPYVRQEAVSCVSMVPWIISGLTHMHSSRFMRCWKNWVEGLATPTPLKRRKTFISFRCTRSHQHSCSLQEISC